MDSHAGVKRLPFSLLPTRLMDALPQRWWALGNLHRARGTNLTWHFCVSSGHEQTAVRTVEAVGRVLAWGHRPFDFEKSQLDGEILARKQEADEERRFGPVE